MPDRQRQHTRGRVCAAARLAAVAALSTVLAAMTVALAPAAQAKCPITNPDCGVPPPDEEPNPNSPPGPGQVTLTGRGANHIDVRWIVPERATGFALQRSTNGGGFVSIAWGGITHRDNGLAPDTRHCYRLSASNAHGSSLSNTICAFTKDGRNLTAFRVQLRVTTGNVDDAGTDDSVGVIVGGAGAGSFGGLTWLDTAADDFERNSTRDYDLVRLDGIAELGDIHSIVFTKQGDDGWCLKEVTLLVDGRPVSSTTFGPPCEWLDGPSGASGGSVDHAALRADPRWASFQVPIPPFSFNPDGTITAVITIPRTELEARIEAMVGHSIHGTDAYWGHLHGRGVEVAPFTDAVAKVDLDLAADVFLSDPEVDIDFNLFTGTHRDAAGNWQLDLTVSGVTADVDLAWWQDVLDVVIPCGPVASVVTGEGIPFCLAHLAEEAEEQISAGIPRLALAIGVGNQPISLTAVFNAQADLVVTAVLPPIPPATGGGVGGIGVVTGPGTVLDPGPVFDPVPDPDPVPGPTCDGLAAAPATPMLLRAPGCGLAVAPDPGARVSELGDTADPADRSVPCPPPEAKAGPNC